MSFSIIFGILEGFFPVFWYSTTPPPLPLTHRPTLIDTAGMLLSKKCKGFLPKVP